MAGRSPRARWQWEPRPAAVALEGAAPRPCHVVQGGQPSCYKHKQRGAAAAGAPAPPQSPPLPPPSRPAARHPPVTATTAPGSPTPRGTGNLAPPVSSASTGAGPPPTPAAAAREPLRAEAGATARGPSSLYTSVAGAPALPPTRPSPPSLERPRGLGSGLVVSGGGWGRPLLAPLCSSGREDGEGEGGRWRSARAPRTWRPSLKGTPSSRPVLSRTPRAQSEVTVASLGSPASSPKCPARARPLCCVACAHPDLPFWRCPLFPPTPTPLRAKHDCGRRTGAWRGLAGPSGPPLSPTW